MTWKRLRNGSPLHRARRPRRRIWTVVLATAVAAPSTHGGVGLTTFIQIDGGTPFEFELRGVDVGGGTINYFETLDDIDLSLSWSINANPGDGGYCPFASLNGGIVLINSSLTLPHSYTVRFIHPAMPSRFQHSIAVASTGGGLTADLDGGTLQSVDGAPIVVARIDGTTVYSAYSTLQLTLPPTLSGTIAPDCSYDPLDFKPPVVSAISFEFTVCLTAGEQLGLNAVLLVGPPPCANLDGDGVVDGADLGLLLAQWSGCGEADLDMSGKVDGADLGLLLAAFGAPFAAPLVAPAP